MTRFGSSSWQGLLGRSITTPRQLAEHFSCDCSALEPVVARYPLRINPYYLSLIERPGDPIWRQAVPDPLELADPDSPEDPLAEEKHSPFPGLVHTYPDRCLFLVSNQCAMYCRFCTRKRKVGTSRMAISREGMEEGLAYIRSQPEIRDVLVSGGDPLLLADEGLDWLLSRLRAIPTVAIIRIGSRVPCTLPMRVTTRLAALLRRYHPLYINTHFNHPREITPEAAKACARLANAGIPLGNQTVLLKGVNDDAQVIAELMQRLLAIRVKPYYLFQADLSRGTSHFKTKVETGLAIIRALIGHTSGMAVPTYALDALEGGKIPLAPDFISAMGEDLWLVNYLGQGCVYRNDG